ncbi:hypothetical protein RFI_25523, partial [Reticulomyxa filosa]
MVDTLYQIKRLALIYAFCNYAFFPTAIGWYSRHTEIQGPTTMTTTTTSPLVHLSTWIHQALKRIIPSFVQTRSTLVKDVLSNPPKLWQPETIRDLSSLIAVGGCLVWSAYSWRYFSRKIRDWNTRYHEYDSSTMDPYLSTLILEQWFLRDHRIFEQHIHRQDDDEEEAVEIDNGDDTTSMDVSTTISTVSKVVHRLQTSQDVVMKPMEHLQEHYHHHSNQVNLSRDLNEMIACLGLLQTANQKSSAFITIVDITCATQQYGVYSSMQKLTPYYTVKNIAIARYKHRTCVIIFHTFA